MVFSPQQLGFDTCAQYFDAQASDLWDQAVFISYFWVAIAVISVASNAGMFLCFGAASERLCFRVRNRMFATYLRQEPGYFDLPENGVGAVSSRLANDATLLKAKTGEPLQQVMLLVFGVLGGVVLAAVFMWPVALMALAIMPVLGAAMTIQTKMIFGDGEMGGATSAEDPAIGSMAGETLTAIRTVKSLVLEDAFVRRYSDLALAGGRKDSWATVLRKALAFGASFAVQQWVFALLLWFSAWIMQRMGGQFSRIMIACD